ncbi:MAG: beta-ketoacyl-[acyl-carrier-protein] synthase family protein [Dokdonella sp.]
MPTAIAPLAITAWTASSAVGLGRVALASALEQRNSGLIRNDFTATALPCWIGRVAGIEQVTVPDNLARYDCRNNRLAWLAIEQDGFIDAARACIERHGADRVALLIGTSTGSIAVTEEGYRLLEDGRIPDSLRERLLHTPHSLGVFLAEALGTRGPCLTIATACSSSAKIFASAERLLRLGLADAAIVAGVDTLCGSVLFGFNALELVSPEPCRPFDIDRRGISIGEAAGFAILERHDDVSGHAGPWLLGHGESSDAWHMSTPHPEGLGAALALDAALVRAGLAPQQIDYINLHGTATRKNDEVEAAVIAQRFPATTRASSSKGWTGHTLGAAGILEAAISLTAIEHNLVPATLNCERLDPACGPQLALANEWRHVRTAMSNSFGFGGNNCSLIFSRDRLN